MPDDDGALRLMVTPASFETVVGIAFNPIREAGRTNARVLRRLADVLTSLAAFARTPPQHAVVARQARALEAVCRAAGLDELRREAVDRPCRRCARRWPGPGPNEGRGRLANARSLADRRVPLYVSPRGRLSAIQGPAIEERLVLDIPSPCVGVCRLDLGDRSVRRLHAHDATRSRLAGRRQRRAAGDRAAAARAAAGRRPDQRRRQPAAPARLAEDGADRSAATIERKP